MPDIYVKGSIIGKSETREFDFRVVKRSAQLGLPQSVIDDLALSEVPGFVCDPLAHNDSNRDTAYLTRVDFGDRCIHQYVTLASEPTIGADALRALGYKVDLAQGHIVKPTGPLEIHRGLMPMTLDVPNLRPAGGETEWQRT